MRAEATTDGEKSSGPGRVKPAERYRACTPLPLHDRVWPNQVITEPPLWCSVDLRDGNQALIEPMGGERKRRLFDRLIAVGFKEIEVGFPAAAASEFEFVRELIETDSIPDDVTIQVLTQAREELIGPTMESLEGAGRAIVHLYNSTSTLQRRVVFGLDRAGIVDIARRGTEMIREEAEKMSDTRIALEYSPESFTGTEIDFALEICEAVAQIWEPDEKNKLTINLPATVEMSTPNIYADQIEYFSRHVRNRERIRLSVHPHNDRGTGVAAAELALMAGAERVEGTLFGNGERTGNVDIVTLALNMLTQGVDPQLSFQDLDSLVRLCEECTRLPIHPRHPYAGDLVFTAFSGSHQDAIKKGLTALEASGSQFWEVPYLPMDPADVGGSYDAIVRVNSQSGKGGVAFLLERDHGLELPRRMQIEFQRCVQRAAEATEGEVDSNAIFSLFTEEYLDRGGAVDLVAEDCLLSNVSTKVCRFQGGIRCWGEEYRLDSEGNGPIDALFQGLRACLGLKFKLVDYREHALGVGSGARAAAYVEVCDDRGRNFFGAGLHESTVLASIEAVISAVDRALLQTPEFAGRVAPGTKADLPDL